MKIHKLNTKLQKKINKRGGDLEINVPIPNVGYVDIEGLVFCHECNKFHFVLKEK